MAKNEKDKFDAKKENSKDQDTKKSGRSGRSRNQRSGNNGKATAKAGMPDLVKRWMSIGQLAIDATTISTYNSAGAKSPSIVYADGAYTPAGIMRLDYVPYFGNVDSPIDPINVAAKNLYDVINAKNSRNPSYDPSDVMIYCIAVANAWGLWSAVRRICGMYNSFDPVNRYWWQPTLETMNISPIVVRKDITAWRNVANRIALNLNRLAVPDNIPYFRHVIDQCSMFYKDADSDKASIYYLHPQAFMMYAYNDDKTGKLINVPAPWNEETTSVPIGPEQVEDFFNSLCVNLFNDTDINTIASDIIKAYGIESCFRCGMIDETYQVIPVYDPYANLMVRNARVAGILVSNNVEGNYELKQNMNVNALTSDFDIDFHTDEASTALFESDLKAGHEVPLDFPYDGPDNAAIMLATRYTLYGGMIGAGSTATKYVHGCTDAIVNVVMYTYEMNDDVWTLTRYNDMCNYECGGQSADIFSLIKKLDVGAKFHDAPLSYIMYSAGSLYGTPQTMHLISDVTNYTTVSTKVLKNIHDAATFSIFYPNSPSTKSRDEG